MPSDTDFGCFGSDSEDSGVSQKSVENTSYPGNCAKDTKNIDDEKRCRERRFQLVEDANRRQASIESAEEAHRHRRPLISPDFEVFDTANADHDTRIADASGSTKDGSTTITTRGMGLRSLRKYSCGDEILREYAVMRVPNQQAASSREEAESMHTLAVQQAFDRLSPATKQFVLNLSNRHNSTNSAVDLSIIEQIVGVYETNSFLLGGGRQNDNEGGTFDFDQNHGGLFLTIARINHSCRPNANHIWRPDLQMTLVFATREIEVGEEISITYGPSGECLDTAGRRAYLEERFSFECGCDMCAESSDERDKGDGRMNELNSRHQEISLLLATAAAATDLDAGGKVAEDALASVEKCLVLFGEQGFRRDSGAFAKQILHYGYQACLLLRRDSEGDMLSDSKRRAQSFLHQELLATENGEGLGSPNVLRIQSMIDALDEARSVGLEES